MAGINGFAAKIFPYAATALLGLLSFLGAALYSRQDAITDAMHENSAALRVLAQKLESYAYLQDERFKTATEHRERLEKEQHAIQQRLDRSGMSQ